MSSNDPREVLELVRKEVAEARADEALLCAADVCHFCGWPGDLYGPPELVKGRYRHAMKNEPHITLECFAHAIHERLHLQALKLKKEQP